jgi:hypothetical protein
MKSRRTRSSSTGKRSSRRQRPIEPRHRRLGEALRRLWERWQKTVEERRRAKARARFWSEVRAGQREAQARQGR